MAMSTVSMPSTIQASSNTISNTSAQTNFYRTYYSKSDIQKIKNFQAMYQNLDNGLYNNNNLYQVAPNLSQDSNFYPGILSPSAINGTLGWINYYRALNGLTPIYTKESSNVISQISASVMAVSNSKPYLDQHYLTNTQRGNYLTDQYWYKAVYGTGYSDLYFGYPQTLGEPIRDLIHEDTNLETNDTGHRAWLLSPKISSVGIGITIANSGRQYENIFVNNPQDIANLPQRDVITYPNAGLFPVEELTASYGGVVPWSISFVNGNKNLINGNTTITVENLTDGTSGTTQPLSDKSYAYINDVITFLPPQSVTINEYSSYRVTISGLNSQNTPSYSYTFKTFSEKANGVGFVYAN